MRHLWLVVVALAWGCGPRTVSSFEDLATRLVTLPNGRQIRAEVAMTPVEMGKGLMFRDSLAAGRGMLFIYNRSQVTTFWMYNTRIPLDIIWLDANHRVVEIAANAQPCKTRASDCAQYGGHAAAQYVLELAAGEAGRNGVRVGENLGF